MLKGREGWRSLFCPCQVTLQWPSVNCAPTISTELFSGLGLGGSHRQCPGQAPVVFSTTHTHEDWFTNGHTRKRWLLRTSRSKKGSSLPGAPQDPLFSRTRKRNTGAFYTTFHPKGTAISNQEETQVWAMAKACAWTKSCLGGTGPTPSTVTR